MSPFNFSSMSFIRPKRLNRKMKEDAAAIRIRQEATEAAEGLVRDKIADKDKAVADAQAKIAEAEGKLSKLSEQHEIALKERLGSQREILEKAKDDRSTPGRLSSLRKTKSYPIR